MFDIRVPKGIAQNDVVSFGNQDGAAELSVDLQCVNVFRWALSVHNMFTLLLMVIDRGSDSPLSMLKCVTLHRSAGMAWNTRPRDDQCAGEHTSRDKQFGLVSETVAKPLVAASSRSMKCFPGQRVVEDVSREWRQRGGGTRSGG